MNRIRYDQTICPFVKNSKIAKNSIAEYYAHFLITEATLRERNTRNKKALERKHTAFSSRKSPQWHKIAQIKQRIARP